jgi:hypothetical protein
MHMRLKLLLEVQINNFGKFMSNVCEIKEGCVISITISPVDRMCVTCPIISRQLQSPIADDIKNPNHLSAV